MEITTYGAHLIFNKGTKDMVKVTLDSTICDLFVQRTTVFALTKENTLYFVEDSNLSQAYEFYDKVSSLVPFEREGFPYLYLKRPDHSPLLWGLDEGETWEVEPDAELEELAAKRNSTVDEELDPEPAQVGLQKRAPISKNDIFEGYTTPAISVVTGLVVGALALFLLTRFATLPLIHLYQHHGALVKVMASPLWVITGAFYMSALTVPPITIKGAIEEGAAARARIANRGYIDA